LGSNESLRPFVTELTRLLNFKGAMPVQVYMGMVYRGPGLVKEILNRLDEGKYTYLME